MSIKQKMALAFSFLALGMCSAVVVPSVTSFAKKAVDLSQHPSKLVCQLMIQSHLLEDPDLKKLKKKKKKKKFF